MDQMLEILWSRFGQSPVFETDGFEFGPFGYQQLMEVSKVGRDRVMSVYTE